MKKIIDKEMNRKGAIIILTISLIIIVIFAISVIIIVPLDTTIINDFDILLMNLGNAFVIISIIIVIGTVIFYVKKEILKK